MANREAIEKTRAALVSAPDHMFDIEGYGSCGSPACLIGWMCSEHGVRDFTPENASAVCEIPLRETRRIADSWLHEKSESNAWVTATRTTAIAMCDLLLEHCDGKRAIEKCTWVEAHAYEKRRAIPASITSALDAREGPLVTDEPRDAELIAAMEAGL